VIPVTRRNSFAGNAISPVLGPAAQAARPVQWHGLSSGPCWANGARHDAIEPRIPVAGCAVGNPKNRRWRLIAELAGQRQSSCQIRPPIGNDGAGRATAPMIGGLPVAVGELVAFRQNRGRQNPFNGTRQVPIDQSALIRHVPSKTQSCTK
jgi:hypothetical protein